GARRSAYRPSASRYRKADRVQDLPSGGAVFRPARLRLADVPGTRLRAGGGKAARYRGAAPGAIYPGAVRRNHALAEPSARRTGDGDGYRRDHAVLLVFRGTRKAARIS